MSNLRVEQLPDKSVNVFFRNLHFKLLMTGNHSRSEWSLRTDQGFEPISNPKVLKWLNRIWVTKVHRAAHPPIPIERFPRLRNQRVMELLAFAKKANNRGSMRTLAKISEQIRSIASRQPGQLNIERWKDIPLASEAPEQPLQWLSKFRIPLRQVSVIVAAKDTYKSMLMLSLAKAATTRGRFLGHSVRQLRVLYLNRDMPKAVFDAYCKTLRLDKSNPRFKMLSSMWDTKIQPLQPDDPLLIRFARRYRPLIIFDYLARFCDGRLKDARDVDRFMEKLKQLTALGATVILLHHVPKNDEQSEGFGSIYIINGADFGWNISRKGGTYAPEEATTLKIQNTKTKMGDYFNLKVRPKLKTHGAFEVITEKFESRKQWDHDVEDVKKLFSTDRWTEKREARKKAQDKGIARSKFSEILEFCINGGIVLVRNAGRGLKQCRLVEHEGEK